jgi:transcription initiation factor TFIIE subunit alpha
LVQSKEYEDPFVRIASMIGGDEYLKVARSLLKAGEPTDEEIASSTGLKITIVRKILYDLCDKSLIIDIKVKDERKDWVVYRWITRREKVEHFIENQKKKIQERLQQRLDYENASDFYHCGNEDCPRVTFEETLDGMFKCPSCQGGLNIKKNEKSRKAYSKKIDEIKKDMQQTF